MRHSITKISTHDYGGTYKVSLRIPFENGNIDHVKFHVWKDEKEQTFDMTLVAKDGNDVCFETEETLESCQLNYYFFSCEVDNRILYDRHVKGPFELESEDKEIIEFYQEVVEFCKTGAFLKKADIILQISWEHLIVQRLCGENEVIIIANRSEHELEITFPKSYHNAQVVFCTEGSNCKILLPDGAIILKK